mmetsp:Transcript_24265/g.56305  ORF Transcript_24265/g.56305 Transcript_24265/m.56305 type:complete len:219 (-) Transcript_24265:1123-1779(-)
MTPATTLGTLMALPDESVQHSCVCTLARQAASHTSGSTSFTVVQLPNGNGFLIVISCPSTMSVALPGEAATAAASAVASWAVCMCTMAPLAQRLATALLIAASWSTATLRMKRTPLPAPALSCTAGLHPVPALQRSHVHLSSALHLPPFPRVLVLCAQSASDSHLSPIGIPWHGLKVWQAPLSAEYHGADQYSSPMHVVPTPVSTSEVLQYRTIFDLS